MIQIGTQVHYTGTPEDTGTVIDTRESHGLTGGGCAEIGPIRQYRVQWGDILTDVAWHHAAELVAI
jgi:hypothetical protein